MVLHLQKLITLLILICCLPQISWSSPEDEEELMAAYGASGNDTITIATGRQQLISKAPAVATVITSEDIQAMGASDLTDVLESVPGLHVSRSSFSNLPIFSFRGLASETNPQSLTMIDGIPLTTLQYGDRGRAWTGMPIHNIERIEIIRGPGSALYGSEAFAGVINIITKDFNTPVSETGVRIGSFDTQEAWLFHSESWNDIKTSLSIEYLHADGHRREISSDLQSTFDGLFGSSASLAPGSINTGREILNTRFSLGYEDLELRLTYRQDFDVGTGAGVSSALDPDGNQGLQHVIADLSHKYQPSADWDITSRFSFTHITEDFKLNLFPPGSLVSFGGPPELFPNGVIGNPRYSERHFRGSLSSFYSGIDQHILQVGAGMHLLDMYKIRESKNFDATGSNLGSVVDASNDPNLISINPATRDNFYGFVQDEWSFAPDWQLTAGVRYDYYSDFAGTFNPRAALVWNADYNLTTKLLYGRAFRAPSFGELRVINNPVIEGNPNLDPETINTVELVFDYQPNDDVNLGLNFFHYQVDDRVDLIFDTETGKALLDNVGELKGSGLEAEFDWEINNQFRVLGNYAFQRAIDQRFDQDLGSAPNHQFYLRGDWLFSSKWKAIGQFNWIGSQEREVDDPRADLSDYMTFDLGLQYGDDLSPWHLAFQVRNVFDENAKAPTQVVIPDDLPLPGRAFYAQLQYRFGLDSGDSL